MKTFLNQVSSKSTREFIEFQLEHLKKQRDCFEIQRTCFAWSNNTGLPAYDFKGALELYIK